MNYDHRLARVPKRPLPQSRDMTPYEANQTRPMANLPQKAQSLSHENIPRLEKITLHVMNKRAVQSKHYLLPTIMALRVISGESRDGGGKSNSTGVQVIKSRTGAANWKLREGMPISAAVEMKGEAMYDFVQCLVDFVMPRLREFQGVLIQPAPSPRYRNSTSGTVQFGFDSAAMGLFPQIEASIDQYPQLTGFNVHFHTNCQGPRAQAMARTLLSGFRIPFHRS